MNVRFMFEKMLPLSFLPYAHMVTDVIFKVGNMEDGKYVGLEDELIKQFIDAGIKAHRDNKSVFMFQSTTGKGIYVGFYDNVVYVGFNYHKV